MTDIALTPCHVARGTARIGHVLLNLLDRIELALEVRRQRRSLLALDNGLLKDVGLDRGSAYAEAARPFWDIEPQLRRCRKRGA